MLAMQVLHAINMVSASLDDLAAAGVPMPDRLAYLDPIGKFYHPRRGREPLYVQPIFVPEPEDKEWEYPEKPWEEWDDFGFRVHMEKMRIKEERHEVMLGAVLALMMSASMIVLEQVSSWESWHCRT